MATCTNSLFCSVKSRGGCFKDDDGGGNLKKCKEAIFLFLDFLVFGAHNSSSIDMYEKWLGFR